MEWDVVEVETIAPLALRVQFADGTVGTVQFEQSHLTGVFSTLRDSHFLQQAHISDGAVVWPGDSDLAPDAMYMAIEAQGEWVLRLARAGRQVCSNFRHWPAVPNVSDGLEADFAGDPKQSLDSQVNVWHNRRCAASSRSVRVDGWVSTHGEAGGFLLAAAAISEPMRAFLSSR